MAVYYGIELGNLPDSDKFVRLILDMDNNQRKWVLRGNKAIDVFGNEDHEPPQIPFSQKIGRNDECPCGSGKKYKKCCGQ